MEGSRRWRILGCAVLVQAAATAVTYGVAPLASFWGWDPVRTGWAVTMVQWGPLLTMVGLGRLMDRWGERWLVGWGCALVGIAFIGLLPGEGTGWWVFCLFMVGMAYGTVQPGGSRVVMRWFSKRERGLAMGIRQAGIPAGGLIAGLGFPWLALAWGWETGVAALAGLAVIAGAGFIWIYRERKEDVQPKRPLPALRHQIRWLCNNPSFRSVLWAGVALISLQMVLIAHWIPFLQGEKWSYREAGWVWSGVFAAGFTGRVVLGWIGDRLLKWGRTVPLTGCLWAGALGLAVLWLPAGWWTVLAGLWLGFFGIGWYPLYLVQVAEAARPGTEGMTVGFALTVNQAAMVVSPVWFGWLVSASGYTVAWGCWAVSLLFAGWKLHRQWKKECKTDGATDTVVGNSLSRHPGGDGGRNRHS